MIQTSVINVIWKLLINTKVLVYAYNIAQRKDHKKYVINGLSNVYLQVL